MRSTEYNSDSKTQEKGSLHEKFFFKAIKDLTSRRHDFLPTTTHFNEHYSHDMGDIGLDSSIAVPTTRGDGPSSGDTPGNMCSGMDVIENVLGMLHETDNASRKALQSMAYSDGKHALELIETSIHSLEDMSKAMSELVGTIERRRVLITRFVNPIHNRSLSIIRLPPDILNIIFEEVASASHPNPHLRHEPLGWMVLSHVCVAWRRVILSLPSVWAGDVGAFRSPESFHTILARAGGYAVTVKNPWDWIGRGSLPDHYWQILSQLSRVRAICLTKLYRDDVRPLADTLARVPSLELHSLALASWWEHSYDSYPTMINYPNLRWISFRNMFFPFIGQNLVGLLITRKTYNTPPGVTCDEFLDSLQTCVNLSVMYLKRWMPNLEHDDPSRKVQLPNLRTLVLIDDPHSYASYIDLCTHLILPCLTYMSLDEARGITSEAIPLLINWLFLTAPNAPCIKDANRLSAAARGQPSTHADIGDKDYRVRIDDGRLDCLSSDLMYKFPMEENSLDGLGVGIHLRFEDMGDDESAPVTDSEFFSSLAHAWVDAHASSINHLILKSVHFDTRRMIVDWDSVFEDLVDVEALYIEGFPRLLDAPERSQDNGMLKALSRAKADGTMLLPRLRTIFCRFPSSLLESPQDEERRNVESLLRQMLCTRAEHGVPVSSMCVGSPEDAIAEDDEDREVNKWLRDLVTSYIIET